MTNDFKEKLLKWFTGNYNLEIPNENINWDNLNDNANNLYTQLANEVGNPSSGGTFIEFNGIIQSNSKNNNGGNLIVMYGTSYNTNKYPKNFGWIALLDNELNLVQLITEYASGTVIGQLLTLNVDEDGNFFGIELPYSGGQKRFIMLNNFALKLDTQTEYSVVLRQSYNVPTDKSQVNFYNNIKKGVGKSKYLMVGVGTTNLIATELTINVGVENDWVDYLYTNSTYTGAIANDFWVNWDTDDNLDFKIVGYYSSDDSIFCEWTRNGAGMSLTTYTLPTNIDKYNTSSQILTKNDVYASCYGLASNDTLSYIIFRVTNGQIYQIYAKENMPKGATVITAAQIELLIVGLDIYYDIISVIDSTAGTYNAEIGRIVGDSVYPFQIGTVQLPTRAPFRFLIVNKQFNLYNFYLQSQDNVYSVYQTFNENNFNGYPYQGLNSMIPNSINLYDENSQLLYARNLYNKIINGNVTISTAEVPNDFINEVTLQLKELISKNNNVIATDNNPIQKNIYEELFVNFINTINIVNNNNPNNSVFNNVGSGRLNNSISNLADYDNAKITKYRINYANGTSQVNGLDPRAFFGNAGTTYGTYKLTIYVPVEYKINTIELISNDEQTSYQTIDCTSLLNGKYYTLTQKLEVV